MRAGSASPRVGQLLQRRGLRAPGAAAGAPAARQLHLVEQDLAQHLRAAEVERAPGQLVDVGLGRGHALAEIGGEAAQLLLVHLDPGVLHVGQHGDQPALHPLVQRGGARVRQPGAQRVAQAQDAVGRLPHMRRRPVGRHLRQRQPGPAGAGHRVERAHGMAQVQPRQVLQRVAVGAGVLRVGQQHRVVHRRRAREPGAGQRAQPGLGIVHHRQHRRVRSSGVHRRRNLRHRELAGPAGPGPPDGRAARSRPDPAPPPGPARPGRPRPTPGAPPACRPAAPPPAAPPALGCRRPRRRARTAAASSGGGAAARPPPPGRPGPAGSRWSGTPWRAARRTARAVRLAADQLLQRLRHRRVVPQHDQLAGQAGLVGMGDQQLAPLGRLHGRGGGQHALQVAELGQQLAGGLRADAGHAGDVVHAVAHQRQQVGHLLRAAAELLAHLVRADRLLLDRVLHDHAGADQLHQVLVGGHDRDLAARLHRSLGVGGDQVVRLPVRQLDGGHVEGGRRVPHQGELRHQLGRRRRALRLVGVVDAVAEGVPPGVEDHRQVGADMVLQQPRQHVGEAEHGVDRRAVRPGHRRQRVEGAEDEPRAVHQDQVQRPAAARPRSVPGARRAPGFSTNTREQYGQNVCSCTMRSHTRGWPSPAMPPSQAITRSSTWMVSGSPDRHPGRRLWRGRAERHGNLDWWGARGDDSHARHEFNHARRRPRSAAPARRLRRPAAALRHAGAAAGHPPGAGRGVHPAGRHPPARPRLAAAGRPGADRGHPRAARLQRQPGPVGAAGPGVRRRRHRGLRARPARLRRHRRPRHLGRRAAAGGRRGRHGARPAPPLPVHAAVRDGREHGRRRGAGPGCPARPAADRRHDHAVPRRLGPCGAGLRAGQRALGRQHRGARLPHQGRGRAACACTPATTARR